MLNHFQRLSASFLVLILVAEAWAQDKAAVISTQVIWEQAAINRDSDIVRWRDSWWVVCCEAPDEFSSKAKLRVISSKDGQRWDAVAELERPVPKASYRYDPAFTILPDGNLEISAHGLQTLSWGSEDGHHWTSSQRSLPKDFEFSRSVWRDGVSLCYAHGTHDGNGSTIQFLSAARDQKLIRTSQIDVDFIPDDAAILFDGPRAYCLVARQAANPIPLAKSLGRQFQSAWLGSADEPYTQWRWKEIEAPLCVPNLLRLPDGRVIAAVGMSDKKDFITLCELDLASASIKEVLDLSVPVKNLIQAAYHRQIVGLAYADGELWVTYHATHEDKLCIHLAKVRLP